MAEIINVFRDVNFEKFKQDIERLKQWNTKLDDVFKLIVDKHSDEFFQILEYVRETKNIIESSKIKYDYAQVSLGNSTSNNIFIFFNFIFLKFSFYNFCDFTKNKNYIIINIFQYFY